MKKNCTFSIEKKLLEEFKKKCHSEGRNISKTVEILMKKEH